jgi:WD40 repeat protein
LTDLKQKAESGQTKLVRLMEEQIPALWQNKQYYEMLRRLRELDALRPDIQGLGDARSEATAAIEAAEAETALADKLLAAKKPRQALDRYMAALGHCGDFTPALTGKENAQKALQSAGRGGAVLKIGALIVGVAAAWAIVQAWRSPDSSMLVSFFKRFSSSSASARSGEKQAGAKNSALLEFTDAAGSKPPGRVLQTYRGHTQPVMSVAVSPDGATILSGGSAGELKLWDLVSGAEIQTFSGHEGVIKSVAFSADGELLLSGGADKTLILWRRATGEQIRVFRGHADKILGVALARDGRSVFSLSTDGTLKEWDAATGKEIRSIDTRADTMTAAAFSPDGKSALVAGFSLFGSTTLWDVADSRAAGSPLAQAAATWALAFAPDGRTAAAGDAAHLVRLWDVSSGREQQVLRGHAGWVESLAFSPDGRILLSSGDDKTVRVWHVASGEQLLELSGHNGRVFGVAFTPDGRSAVSASEDRTLRLWKLWEGNKTGP